MRIISTFLLLAFFQSTINAQDLSGLWRGTRDNALLYVVKYKDKYIGYTYDEGAGFCECNFVGEFDVSSQRLKGRNEGFIRKAGMHTQGSYNLRYSVHNGVEQLTGTWLPRSVGGKIMSFGVPNPMTYYKHTSATLDTTVFMTEYFVSNPPVDQTPISAERKTEVKEENIVTTTPATEKPAVPVVVEEVKESPAPVINEPIKEILKAKETRVNDTISTFPINSKTIRIQLIDNGVVDGDTISLMHNGKVIADRVAVTAKAYSIDVQVDENAPVQEITLIAHNLGSIPPNTALVLIQAGEKKFRLNASSDLTHNAVILFRHE